MAWKLPRRRFKATNAVDVDDFNDALYPVASEGGRLTEHNFDNLPFSSGDAQRLLLLERDIGLRSDVQTDVPSSPIPLLSTTGWITATEKTIITGDATLRVTGRFELSDDLTVYEAAIRIDGVLDYDSLIPDALSGGHASIGVFSLANVPAGEHLIELVVRNDRTVVTNLLNRTITIITLER